MIISSDIAKKVLEKNGYKFIKVLGTGSSTAFYECEKNGQKLAVKFQFGSGNDKKAEDYLNTQKNSWFKILSFEEAAKPENKGIFFDFIKKINPNRYYKYLNLPKALENNIANDLIKEKVKIPKGESVYISEAMLVDDTYGRYVFEKIKNRWKKKFEKLNAGNKKLLNYLNKVLTQFPDLPISDIEKKMIKFANKENITLNRYVVTDDKKEHLRNKVAYEMLPVLTGAIKGLSVLHSKNRAHTDLHTGNLYLKKVGEKIKIQVADFDRIVSEKEASEYHGLTLDEAMCEDIKAIFRNCNERIIKDLYRLTLEDMPQSFKDLYQKVQNDGYSNASKLLKDSYYKRALVDLKQMAKKYEEYKKQKLK